MRQLDACSDTGTPGATRPLTNSGSDRGALTDAAAGADQGAHLAATLGDAGA